MLAHLAFDVLWRGLGKLALWTNVGRNVRYLQVAFLGIVSAEEVRLE